MEMPKTSGVGVKHVNAIEIQQSGIKFYIFCMRAEDLRRISYVLPRSKDNPNEIQRVLTKARLDEIGKFLSSPGALLPNNIVLNFDASVTFTRQANSDIGTLTMPFDSSATPLTALTETDGKVAAVLDGQHRLAGFDKAPQHGDFVLPVAAFINLDQDRAALVFSEINSHQVKPSSILLQEIMRQIGSLSDEKKTAVSLVEKLNAQEESPWHNLIKTTTSKGIMSPVTFAAQLKGLVVADGPLQGKTELDQLAILRNYFNAFRKMYPTAWGVKSYVLTKVIGLSVMTGVFRRAMDLSNKYHGSATSVDVFVKILEPLAWITWESKTYGKFANAASFNALRNAALKILPLEDNAKPDFQDFTALGIERPEPL